MSNTAPLSAANRALFPASATARPGGQLRSSLVWALLHAPLFLLIFGEPLARAIGQVPANYQIAMWTGAVAQAVFLAGLMFLATLPFALLRAYAAIAPLVCGLATVLLGLDGLLYRGIGFHFNRLFLEVALQPGALRETGLAAWELMVIGALVVAVIALEFFAGRAFIRRTAAPRRRRAWPLLALLPILLGAAERTANASMAFFAGDTIRAAGRVLPLQAPLRMNKLLGRWTGNREMADPADLLVETAGQPLGKLAASEVKFTRKPDVVIVLIESLRADFLDATTMPELTRRAERGVVFDRHYSSASSTHFSLFSLFYGIPATQRDKVLGAGQTSLLFPSLKANGYQSRLIAASSVDWMELTRSVFADVQGDLETNLPGEGYECDDAMLASARRFVDGADPEKPVFLFLFFVGTHFRYSYPESAEVLKPCWDGKGSIAAGRIEPVQLERRARNAAFEIDRKTESFLQYFEERRGKAPLLVITSDHGEEYLEHGRLGHSSDVTKEQLHVPFVLFDEGLEPGRRAAPTGHIDLLPTLLQRLGDEHEPSLYSSGVVMTEAPEDRYLLSTVGWLPRLALIGRELKIRFNEQDGGFGEMRLTDPFDRPLDDDRERFAREYPSILRSLRQQRR